jgi:acetyl esterase/lipase
MRRRVWIGFAGVLLACAGAVRAQGPAAREVFVEDVQYAEGFAKEPRRNRLDLYVPAVAVGVAKPPLVMFVHGGGWTGGKKEFGAGLAHAFVQRGIACACINTQQFPFATPAAMVEDCGHALAWLHAHAREHGYDGDRLFVMGHSSGGHLVSWLALDDERLAATGVARASLRGAIALSGVHELRAHHPLIEKVFGADLAARRDASPLAHASAGDPPMLLLWGERDMPGLALCSRMLRDRLRDCGVAVQADELAGCDHVDYVFRLAPGDPVFERIVAFVQNPPRSPGPSPAALAAVPAPRAPGTSLVWVTDGDEAVARAIAAALAPFGIALTKLDGRGARPETIAVQWRQLSRDAAARGLPAPAYLGGAGSGGLLAVRAPLAGADGLRGRIVAGSALEAADARTLLAAPSPRPALLVLEGEGDPKVERDVALGVAIQLVTQRVDALFLEASRAPVRDALQQLGGADDVLLAALRAFVLP